MELLIEILLNVGLVFFFVFALAVFVAIKEKKDNE